MNTKKKFNNQDLDCDWASTSSKNGFLRSKRQTRKLFDVEYSESDDENEPKRRKKSFDSNYSEEWNDDFVYRNQKSRSNQSEKAFVNTLATIPTGSLEVFRKCLDCSQKIFQSEKSKIYYLWSLFVVFMKAFKKDPYSPTSCDLANFLKFLRISNFQTEALKPFLLRMLTEMSCDNADTLQQLQTWQTDENSSNTVVLKTVQNAWINRQAFNRFIQFCCRRNVNKNPFECDDKTVSNFLEECLTILQRTSISFPCGPVLTRMLLNIKFFQKGKDFAHELKDCVPDHLEHLLLNVSVYNFFETVKSVDLGFDQVIGSLLLSRPVLKFTSDFKYLKYVQNRNASNFWQEEVVADLLQEAKSGNMTQQNLAVLLGVSLEMLKANSHNKSRPLVMKTFFDKNRIEKFWEGQRVVRSMMISVRTRKVTLEEGAFQLGVAVADLESRVGPLDPLPKQVEKPKPKPSQAKPKMNALEKLIKGEDENLSEYELLRLKNIRERLALFNQMDFNSTKNSCVVPKATKNSEKDVLPPREKSRRIKTFESAKTTLETADTDDSKLPPIPPTTIPLADLVSLDAAPGDNHKFLSALEQEVEWAQESEKRETSTSPSAFKIKSVCALFPEEIRSAAMMPDSNLNVVCAGGKNGSLGVWIVKDENEVDTSTSMFASNRAYCNFKLHASQINYVSFNPFSPTKVVTSSNDGYIRSTDLMAGQTSETIIKWYSRNIESPFVYHGFISNHEMIIGQTSVKVISKSNQQSHVNHGMVAFLHDTRCQVAHSLIGSDMHFECPSLSLHPNNPNLLAGLSGSRTPKRGVYIYDLRRMTQPLSVTKIFTQRVSYVEYSPDGSQLLVGSHSTKSDSSHTFASVLDLNENVHPGTNGSPGIKQMSKSLYDLNVNHYGARPCVWHPTHPGALVALDLQKTGISSIVTIDPQGSIINPDKDIFLNHHYGLVSDPSKGAILALNSLGKGSIAVMKIEDD